MSAPLRACNAEEPLAEFVNATWSGGGTLAMRGGPKFKATSNMWNTKWQVEDPQSRVMLAEDSAASSAVIS